mgnify:CR=1 FL=1
MTTQLKMMLQWKTITLQWRITTIHLKKAMEPVKTLMELENQDMVQEKLLLMNTQKHHRKKNQLR